MIKKLIGLSLVFIISFLVVACNTTEKASEGVVKAKTYDELKQAKEEGKPISEFDKCIKEAEKLNAEKDKFEQDCIANYLNNLGYKDGINCIQNFEQKECQDEDRYNADVNAYNYCLDERIAKYNNTVTVMDCYQLLDK